MQNAAEHFTVFQGTKANLLCSKVCRYHFIQKNESLVSCSFCNEWSFDLYSLQMIDQQQQQSTQTSDLLCFCSVSCCELFVESKSDCIGSEYGSCGIDGNGQEVNDHEQMDQNNVDDNDYDEDDDALIFKTVSTQTNELIIKCTCDSGNMHVTKYREQDKPQKFYK